MKKLIIGLFVFQLLVFSSVIGDQMVAFADEYKPTQTACESLSPEQQAANPACSASGNDPITNTSGTDGIIMKIATILAWFAGAIAVIIMIFAGFRLVKSSGEPAKVTQARETIIYALVGLVVIVVARFLVGFVIGKL